MKSMFLLGRERRGAEAPLTYLLAGHSAPDRVRLFTLDLERGFRLPLAADAVLVVGLGVHQQPRRSQRSFGSDRTQLSCKNSLSTIPTIGLANRTFRFLLPY